MKPKLGTFRPCCIQAVCLALTLNIVNALDDVKVAYYPEPDNDAGPLYHYDKEHPINLTVKEFNFTLMTVAWQMPRNMSESDLENFVVFYHKRSDRTTTEHFSKSVGPDTFETLIKGLTPGTKYSFYVLANYSSGHMPVSSTYTILLNGYGQDNPCQCDRIGTNISSGIGCDVRTGQCNCIKGAVGKQCNSCDKYYYRHNVLGCRQCPKDCHKSRSDQTCRTEGNGIVCNCYGLYSGRACEGCINGYYMTDGKTCEPCECNNNTKPGADLICDRGGNCLNCGFGTTGQHCELCLPDHEGDALAQNCTFTMAEAPVYVSTGHKNAVVGVVIAFAIVILVLAAVLIYKKCWLKRKKPLQFWTVELRDDHEQVNFSTMMEQPDYHNVDASLLNDSRYYEKDSPQLSKTQTNDTDVIIETTSPGRGNNAGRYKSVPGMQVNA